MFGNETQTGGLPGRAGEFNLAGNNIIIRAGKAPGNFGAIAAQIFADRSVTFNTATTRKLGNSNWTVISDKRLKNNVRSYDGGLDEVLNINPVWYTYNGEMGTDKSREFVGVLAQEFQKVAPYDVQEVSLTDEVTEKSASYLSINDSAIKYMLVNAIKEQQTMIEDLQGQIADLQDLIGSVDDNTSVDDVNLVDVSQSVLGQNTPNPYIEGTVISYSVAESASSAKMNFYSLTGQLIKSVSLQNGAGKVNVSADELPSGTYTYSLEVDGALISNKKMVKMR
jgi:polyhydroxyalkanoate synthesis regulator phasin